ncbi:glycerate kinase, partial [Paenibacillus sp. Y412MC10]|uniref:glycerate kinase n=1 Tax=Geobacillus sp. (strain Y412MC10) TaxID=481743 RepID=UPI0021B44188
METEYGKIVVGVVRVGKKDGKGVVGVGGGVGEGMDVVYDEGMEGILGMMGGGGRVWEGVGEGVEKVERRCENIVGVMGSL